MHIPHSKHLAAIFHVLVWWGLWRAAPGKTGLVLSEEPSTTWHSAPFTAHLRTQGRQTYAVPSLSGDKKPRELVYSGTLPWLSISNL